MSTDPSPDPDLVPHRGPNPRSSTGRGDPAAVARRRALDLLATREHSARELRLKLLRRGDCPEPVLDAVLADLAEDGLLDERRFVAAFVRARRGRGQGPLRIEADLRQRGVPPELIDVGLDDAGNEDGLGWTEVCRAARLKRFGRALPSDWNERARQMRFLRTRGFTEEQIRAATADETE